MKLKVAVLQYECPEDVDNSINKLDEMVSKASQMGARLVVAPETSIGMLGDVKSVGTDYLPELLDISKRRNLFLSTSFYKKQGEKIFNQGYIISDKGGVVLEYKKIYLAPPEKEEHKISAGKSLSICETEIGKMGMLICKDGFTKYSHFLYEKFNNLGTEIICAPTWSIGWKNTVGNDEYVKALYTYGSLISRSYVLMAGNLNKSTESFGRSLIISPVLGVIQEGSRDKEEILVQEIDLDEVKRIKTFDSWWQPEKRII
jgi:predicted amidohydrolase